MVLESDWLVAKVVRGLGVSEGMLGDWVSKYGREHAVRGELSLLDRVRWRGLERENQGLWLMSDFLGKVAACFAREQ